jgi:F-type H+-transporting ATPase subunit b
MLKSLMMFVVATALLMPARAVLAQEAEHPAAPGAAGAEGAAREGGHAAAPLLPDLEAKSTYLEALWVVIIFVALLAILYPTAWKNVLAGLKKREERIRSDIAEAEAARAKAEATLKEYNTKLAAAEESIRELLNKAAADGEKLATNIRMKAQVEAEDIKDRATKDIEAARDTAVRDFREYAADIATSVAEKIIRKNLNAADQQELVRQSLDQLQSVK